MSLHVHVCTGEGGFIGIIIIKSEGYHLSHICYKHHTHPALVPSMNLKPRTSIRLVMTSQEVFVCSYFVASVMMGSLTITIDNELPHLSHDISLTIITRPHKETCVVSLAFV